MSKSLELEEFKQQIAAIYNQRSHKYDSEGNLHQQWAYRLVEYAHLRKGERILDIATGTGLVAIAAAERVGESGRVVGVDISPGMLQVVKQKIETRGLNNIQLIEADAETLDFPDNSFDVVFCASALIFMRDIPAALRLWHRFLVPGGRIGIQVVASTAFVTSVVLQKVAKKYGVELIFNELTGTEEKCYLLLKAAGFEDIEVKAEQFGNYVTLAEAQGMWESMLNFPLCLSLRKLEPEKLMQVKAEYFTELELLATEKGIWNDILTFFVFGRKIGATVGGCF